MPKQRDLFLERIVGVRGPLTARTLGLGMDVVVGDPGLLVGRVIDAPQRDPRGITIPPHFREFHSRKAVALLRSAEAFGMKVVAPNSAPLKVAEAVATSELVLSSSLHGLIFADALDVPSSWIRIGPHKESSFKFQDYFESVGYPRQRTNFSDWLQADRTTVLERRRQHITISQKLRETVSTLTQSFSISAQSLGLRRPAGLQEPR
ncbi:polysaccharide pyruvyl transferase family protein [Nocardioides sp. IC4_145]|nr:polysaccharide pyruvyl transferase family protein [Nocardioides sp. IC4_145]